MRREFCVFCVEPLQPTQGSWLVPLEPPKSPKRGPFQGVQKIQNFFFKFRPIRSLLWKSHDHNGGLWLVKIFILQIWHIWPILRPFYPWSFFDSGIISKKNSLKTHFWGPFHKFFSRILNNSLKKWDFIKNMSMPKVGNQKLQEQKMFSKNGQ